MLHLSLPTEPASITCGCGRVGEDVPQGVPEGWDAEFRAGAWTFCCPRCAGHGEPRALSRAVAVMATFRPRLGDIFVIAHDDEQTTRGVMTIEDARALHGALGQALRIADCVGDPVSAVPGSAD